MDYSQITPDLFIGTTPDVADYDELRQLGVRLVINMRYWTKPLPDRHPQKLQVLWLRSVDSPLCLIPMHKLVQGTEAAMQVIGEGGKIYSHCAKGRHRSVAMGASILIAQGYGAEQAMDLIKRQRPISDPRIFYIRGRILKFAKMWPGGRGQA